MSGFQVREKALFQVPLVACANIFFYFVLFAQGKYFSRIVNRKIITVPFLIVLPASVRGECLVNCMIKYCFYKKQKHREYDFAFKSIGRCASVGREKHGAKLESF